MACAVNKKIAVDHLGAWQSVFGLLWAMVFVLLAVATPARAQELVQNGGFETNGFQGWTQSGNLLDAYIASTEYVHSGGFGAQLGPPLTLGFLSQNLATVPGKKYLLSLWLFSPSAIPTNEFSVSWNGTNLFDQVNIGGIGWTNLQFIVKASSANTPLQIGFRNDPSYFGLDDVSVQPAKPIIAVYGAPATTTWNNDVTNKLFGTGLFSRVDGYIIEGSAVPTLAQLQQYDCVMAYSDVAFTDPAGMGNVLADYVDSGGGVVLADFDFSTNFSGYIQGRIVSGGYSPITLGTGTSSIYNYLVADQPLDPILSGVNSFNGGTACFHTSGITITSGARLIAHWSDGQPLVATKQITSGRVVALNFFPPSSDARTDFWDATSDGARLMANAMIWAIKPSGPAQPSILWNTPASIVYTTPLGSNQLDAKASVPGSFVYSPPSGTILGAGLHLLTAVFTPDGTNYATVTNMVNLVVLPMSPVIVWDTPSPVRLPFLLTSIQLNATCNIPGNFVYNPPLNTVLNAGNNLLSVVFTPIDITNYTRATNTVILEVDPKIAPVISWTTPSTLAFGTPLGPQQLNASANTSGSFAYFPPAGTVLPPGSTTVLAGFTPSDTYDYNAASKSVNINVLPPTPQQEFTLGHLLQITGNENDFYDGFNTFINTITIYNPTMSESRAGYVDLYDQSFFSGNEDISQTAFPPIPAGGSIQVTLSTTGEGQDSYFATVYEDGLYDGDSAHAEDSQEIFTLFSTSTGPSGGVPTGGGTLSAPGFSVPPQFTNLVLSGPAFVNENSSATFVSTAYFNDGSTNGNLSPSWSSSLPEIVNGNFTASSVSTDTVVNLSAQITLRGVTRTASTTTTVVKVQQPKLKFLSGAQNQFQLELAGTTGLRFELQAATNFGPGQIWAPIVTNQILSNSVTEFSLPIVSSNKMRLYRARLLP
jgi:hypothetical protein